MTDIVQLESELNTAITAADSERALEDVRVSALGKKGSIAELLKTLGSMSADDRKTSGPLFNGLRDRIAGAIAARKKALEEATLDARLQTERVLGESQRIRCRCQVAE